MASLRAALSLVALLVAVGGAGALAWYAVSAPSAGEHARYPLLVLGPEGEILNATVEAENATVLLVLERGAETAGIPLVVEDYPGMGVYVRAIGTLRAGGPSGWIYEVLSSGEWQSGDRSAALRPLHAGESVRWTWTEA